MPASILRAISCGSCSDITFTLDPNVSTVCHTLCEALRIDQYTKKVPISALRELTFWPVETVWNLQAIMELLGVFWNVSWLYASLLHTSFYHWILVPKKQ